MARVRRDVWNLGPADETLLWYARAVGAMLQRPFTDPTSWRYMAAVHDYDPSTDPYKKKGEKLPPPREQQTFWFQCQHGSWYFLPWHRMYLYYFEQIVAAEVAKQGGPPDWALPYWNYSEDYNPTQSSKYQLLPEAFRTPPDAASNHLYVGARDPKANQGQPFIISSNNDSDVDILKALSQTVFYTDDFNSSGEPDNFGGYKTGRSHSGGEFGGLESEPHNSMHMAIGGRKTLGWMTDTTRAALDPIFWLHHANIDRLWQVWLNQASPQKPGEFQNPQAPDGSQWLTGVAFSFHDVNGHKVTMRPADVVDTNTLGYTYEDTTPPAQPIIVEALVAGARTREAAMPEPNPPELAGATEKSVPVKTSGTTHITVPTPAHAVARDRIVEATLAANTSEEAARQHRVYLRLENVTAPDVVTSYDVYVNVPNGDEPTDHPELFAGRLNPFGIARASSRKAGHAGSGLTFTLNITNIYHALASAPGWDPNRIDVALVPLAEGAGAKMTVGRVSVFFA